MLKKEFETEILEVIDRMKPRDLMILSHIGFQEQHLLPEFLQYLKGLGIDISALQSLLDGKGTNKRETQLSQLKSKIDDLLEHDII